MSKSKITVNAELASLEQAKELLADLEVLNEKYDISFYIEKNNYSLMSEGLSSDDDTDL
ncbi:hypothetical protein P7I20_14810 [Enterococcus casseliflavus]|uniref:hypothetical protein n=1 Tax=Enterococcus casseliflavus TaxID=37734 RepID=UPI00288F3377|nr:hypothetical protein [Enterococcus casseliflavus]MDT2980650.1 hypothetical protein [Enterococcus casseliflavus]